MSSTPPLRDDANVVQRLLDHIDGGTTDLGDGTWHEPVEHYRSPARFAAERAAMRTLPLPFCPSAALPKAGSWVARDVAGTPLLAVRGDDGEARVFRNACRHRGTEMVRGSGCQRAFACPYHGWTYALDGALRHVPHEYGFPGMDKEKRGLVPVASRERGGLVFVTQDADCDDAALAVLPMLIPDTFRFVGSEEVEIPANWKVLVEGFLEGYHIKATHKGTFYPIQYDNVNVVERFGRNNRVTFPYQSIEKQRDLPPAERSADGTLTYLYHLFPNAVVATFPGRRIFATLEPVAIDRTFQSTWAFTDRDEGDAGVKAFLDRGRDLVEAGTAEDREMACAIQRGLESGANTHFEYGRFEAAIVHFHQTLQQILDAAD